MFKENACAAGAERCAPDAAAGVRSVHTDVRGVAAGVGTVNAPVGEAHASV